MTDRSPDNDPSDFSSLTWEERVVLAHQLSQGLTEQSTDRLLDLMERRAMAVWHDRAPKWLRYAVRMPLVPHPVKMLRKRLDGYLPEIVRDPLIAMIMGEGKTSTTEGDKMPDEAKDKKPRKVMISGTSHGTSQDSQGEREPKDEEQDNGEE